MEAPCERRPRVSEGDSQGTCRGCRPKPGCRLSLEEHGEPAAEMGRGRAPWESRGTCVLLEEMESQPRRLGSRNNGLQGRSRENG